MAETNALTAYKAGLKEAKGSRKKRKVFYFPIIRTLTTFGGVAQMINMRYLQGAVKFLLDGEFEKAGIDAKRIFQGANVREGATMIATGITLGKALDHFQANPRVKMGSYGVKLV